MKKLSAIIIASALLLPLQLGATKLIGISVIDKDILCLQFRDGEVRYRDDATGPSAYLGHSFAEGDDTLVVYGKRLDCAVVAEPSNWKVISDGRSFSPLAVYRKSKQMNTDHTLKGELDHCYPSWYDGGWPRQESYFNQRYLWVNGEFTPRETMRGKMALLAYLYGIKR